MSGFEKTRSGVICVIFGLLALHVSSFSVTPAQAGTECLMDTNDNGPDGYSRKVGERLRAIRRQKRLSLHRLNK